MIEDGNKYYKFPDKFGKNDDEYVLPKYTICKSGVLIPFHGRLDLFLTGAVAILFDGLIHNLLTEFTTFRRIHVLHPIIFKLGLRITEIQTGIPHLVDGGHLAFTRATWDILDTIHFFS